METTTPARATRPRALTTLALAATAALAAVAAYLATHIGITENPDQRTEDRTAAPVRALGRPRA